jgi:hypothetical protein
MKTERQYPLKWPEGWKRTQSPCKSQFSTGLEKATRGLLDEIRKLGGTLPVITCMELPAGKTCGDCGYFSHCKPFYGRKSTDTECDFFPRRFRERVAIAKAQGGTQ